MTAAIEPGLHIVRQQVLSSALYNSIYNGPLNRLEAQWLFPVHYPDRIALHVVVGMTRGRVRLC